MNDSNSYEDEYYRIFQDAMRVHHQRVKKYGSSWCNMGESACLEYVNGKVQRLTQNHKSHNIAYETVFDNAMDAMNYLAFYSAIVKIDKAQQKNLLDFMFTQNKITNYIQ